ncbi:amino acid adenylation domain-containing protein [Streptosporangium sp. NPDC004379]|uniref:amino acid adenylation domain-containing protein n=1 Tax=Streptosporangium sp. NPDC004379 TaxID=3366189 RepID=UPI003693E2E3
MTGSRSVAVIGTGPCGPLSAASAEAALGDAGHDPSQPPGVLALHESMEDACRALLSGVCDIAVTRAGAVLAGQGPADRAVALRRLGEALLDGDPVHAVLDTDPATGRPTAGEGLPPVHPPSGAGPRVVVWSGRTVEEADAVRRSLAGFFASLPGERFADAVATLQRGRTPHPFRGAVVCSTAAEAAHALATAATASDPARDGAGVRFVFPPGGTGRLGAALYGAERLFTESMDVCLEEFERHGIDLCDEWLAGKRDDAPVTFAVTCSLAATLTGWGVTPAACSGDGAGEGAGEIAAAAVAGTRGFGEAVALVACGGTVAPEPARAAGTPETGEAGGGGAAVAGSVRTAGTSGTGGTGAPRSAGAGETFTLVLGPAASSPGGPAIDCGDDRHGLMTALARLWTLGCRVDWEALDPDHPLQRMSVPGGFDPAPAEPAAGEPLRRTGPPEGPAGRAGGPGEPVRKPGGLAGLPEPAEPPRPPGPVPYSFWVLEQLAGGSGVSNLAVAFRTREPLRRFPLQNAVNRLLRRHPALRLRFPEVDGAPVRHLTAPQDARITLASAATTEETMVADLQAFLDEPFDLAGDLLFRAGHFTLPEGGGSVVCLVAHHIVVDATSMQFLVEELGAFYDAQTGQAPLPARLAGPAPMLEPGRASRESIGYWLDRLEGADPAAMPLPGSRPSPERPTFAGHTCSWEVDAATRRALDTLRTRLRTTDNMVLTSAFLLALRCHGAGPDMVVGVPVSTRTAATRDHVGYGVSTMPLRVRTDPQEGFAALVRRVEDAFFEGVEHADASVETVLVERGHGTGDWRVPLFRHMFNYRPWTDERVSIQGSVPEYVEDLFDRSRLDLQCIAVHEPDRLTVRVWHSTEVHDETEITAFVARMTSLLRQAAEDPELPQRALEAFSPVDRALLDRLNDTGRRWSGPPTLPERIAAHRGDAVAVVDGDREVRYGELLDAAGAVRDALLSRGIGPGDIVALGLGRSVELVAAVLGVWAAGAAYLPLDPGHPELRLAYQVRDAGARLVVAPAAVPWAGEVPVLAVPCGPVSGPEAVSGPMPPPGSEPGPGSAPGSGTGPGAEAADRVSAPDAAPVSAPTAGDALAYVIYTSGSTGRPKGVAVTHGNLANLVLDFAGRLGPDAAARVLWSTTPSFDISALELLLPLVGGGTLVIASDADRLRPRGLLDLVAARDVRVVQATPTAWRLAVPEAGGELAGRTVLCGGEPLPAALARDLLALGCRLFNVYGPTETTIWSTAAEIAGAPRDPVPIGAPLANTRIFVRDADGREAPPGVPGELCVAGDGVAAGYVDRPELTAERFGAHPRHGRFYRTGDLARLRHDGTLDLLGRDDRQVKLRGHRIELGEVEAVLHDHETVGAAAVVVRGDTMTAFVRPAREPADRAAWREELWRHARTRLPDYAVPSGFVLVDRFPETGNGKIDYRSLTVPEEEHPAAPAAAAGSPLVEGVLRLWREALGRPGLGEHDNFFLSGGHSVLAVRLIAPLEELVGHPIGVRAIFDHPTPAGLAAFAGTLTGRAGTHTEQAGTPTGRSEPPPGGTGTSAWQAGTPVRGTGEEEGAGR